jgi:phosphoesterase RecJ-like protein
MKTSKCINKGKKKLQEIDAQFFTKYQHELFMLYEKIKSAQKILLISHQKPDGDTSGSAIAMAEMLDTFGKKYSLFDADPLAEEFQFLEKSSEYIHDFDLADYDLAIAFDGGSYKMFGLHEKYPELFDGRFPLVNIDHHVSNEMYGMINFVEEKDAATTIVVSKIFRTLQWNISPKIATPLLMGLYTDTGSLMHSNATAHTHREASFLLGRGADLHRIVKHIFNTKTLQRLRLWGLVLSRAQKDSEGVTSSYITLEDFARTKSTPDDLTGVIDYLNAVPDSKYSILFTQPKPGKVKGSLRTLNQKLDLTQYAGKMGGGGHKQACGFTVEGDLSFERKWKIDTKGKFPENFEETVQVNKGA